MKYSSPSVNISPSHIDSPDKITLPVVLIIAFCSLVPIWHSGWQGYFFHGDNYALMLASENIAESLSIWRKGYMTGLAGLADYFQAWPELFSFWLLSKVGVPISLSSRVGYFAILFALQLAFYKLFCTFFADIIRERENLVLGALTGALFTIFNPYTFNALVGGQPEYLRALAAFLFFSHSVYKLFFLNSKKRVLHIIVCVLSTTFFMGTNYFLSAFYLFICLIIMVIILTKCRGQYPLLFSLLLLIVLVNVWWAIPLLLVNLNSQVIATGMKQIDPDKALQSSSALDFFINLRIHYGRLGQMYPAQPHLNDFFLTFFNKLCGFLLLAFSLSCFFLYRSKTIFYLVVAATLFSFLQMGGAAVSFSLLWETIPFFKIFRQPYKFTMVLFIFQAALLGLFSAWILSKTWKRVYKLSLAIGLCCIIFLNMLPMLAGNLGGILTPLVIPQDYWEFKTKVDYTDESYRILALPQTRGVLKYSWADENTGVSFLDRFFRHPLLEIKVKTIFNNYSKRLLEDNLDSKNAVAAWKLLGVKYVLDRHDVSRNRKEISQIPFSSHQAVFQKQELVPFMSTKNLSIYKLDGSYPLVFSPKSLKLKSKPVPLSEMDEKQLWLPQQFLLSAFDRTEIDRGLYAFSWVDRHSDFLKYAIQEANEIKESEDYLNLSVKDITLDSPPQIEFQRCSSTRFIVRISNVKHGFPLVLNESYDRGWSVFYISSPTVKSSPDIVKKYRPGIVEIKEYPQPSPFFSLFEKPLFKASHTLGNGFANMWWITPDKLPRTENGDLLLMIEYNAQPFVYLSLVVSSLTVISLFSWFLFSFSTRSIRVTMLCLIAILVFPTTSVSASEDEIDFFFVHNERGIKSVFYGNVQSSYKTDSPTTIKIRAIARPTHTYYKVKQQDLPLSWNEHICETPPCSQEIVLDFRDSPIKLNLTQKIILTGQKENRQGRMGVIGRAIIADTAHLEASPREIHFFTTLNDSTPIERYTAEDFSIIPKDISYLIKRELGLSNNKLWRSSQDQDRLVLQTRTNVLLTDDTIFKLTIKERYMPESIQFSIGRLGLGGRQAFILDSQTRKSSRRIGNGYVEVKVDFNGVLNRLGFDPEQAFILEPILFLPMDEKTFKRVAPIKEVAFLRGHPAASLSRLNNQEVQLEVFLNQLEEDLPPSTVLQQLNLNIQLYNYDQFVATKLGLVTHEELFQPSIFLAGEKALSSWGIKEKTEGGRRSFRPALFPLFKQNEYAQTPFNDKDIAISGTTPYKLTKGDSQIKLTGVFPDSDSLLNLTILPQKQPRFLRFSLKSASMKRLSMKNQHGGILFTTQGIKLPTEQALNFTIVPPHSNTTSTWDMTVEVVPSTFTFSSVPPLTYALAPSMDSENDGLDYAFSSDGTTSFVGEVSFVDQSGVISTKPISFSPQSPPPTFPKSKIVKLDYFQIYRKLYNLNPRHLPVLFQFLDLENNDISFYEWWSKTGMVQLVPTRGISLNNGEIAVTPSMGASSIIFKPQGSFLYADAIVFRRPLPDGCTLTLLSQGERIPLFIGRNAREINIANLSLIDDDIALEIGGLSTSKLVLLPMPTLRVFGKQNTMLSSSVCSVLVGGIKVKLFPQRIVDNQILLQSSPIVIPPGEQSFEFLGNEFIEIMSASIESDRRWSVVAEEDGSVSGEKDYLIILFIVAVMGLLLLSKIGLLGNSGHSVWSKFASPYCSLTEQAKFVFWLSIGLPALGTIYMQSRPDIVYFIIASLPISFATIVFDRIMASRFKKIEFRSLETVLSDPAIRILAFALLLIIPIALLQSAKLYKTGQIFQVILHILIWTSILRKSKSSLDIKDQ